jgi:hypothetical protein
MVIHALLVLLVLCLSRISFAATAADWRSRSIYQVFTDRFAVPNNTEAPPCDTSKGRYCGGNWQGIIDKLDYIQDLGFSAVRPRVFGFSAIISINLFRVTEHLNRYGFRR